MTDEPITARITTRRPIPEQMDVARDIVQTWSINQSGGNREAVSMNQVVCELLGLCRLTQEFDWLLQLIQMMWDDPKMVVDFTGDEGFGFIWVGELLP